MSGFQRITNIGRCGIRSARPVQLHKQIEQTTAAGIKVYQPCMMASRHDQYFRPESLDPLHECQSRLTLSGQMEDAWYHHAVDSALFKNGK